MDQHIFREFSIRGKADRDLPDDVVRRIGQAIGTYFGDREHSRFVLGRDVRLSSPRISAALRAGLLTTGATVIDVGFVPTPVLNFATDHFKGTVGIMVTASHNPPADNGFKLRTDQTVMGAELQQLYLVAETGLFRQGQGQARQADAVTPYLAALKARSHPRRRLKLVVDGGNGANGPLVSTLLRSQHHTVIDIFADPDGTFPHRSPDPTQPGALDATAEAILRHQADVGLAFDGDGDRLTLLDETGAVHVGDTILMLLARHAAAAGPVTLAHDISCTKALADDVAAHGGQTIAAPVGYAFVQQVMFERGLTLGGEASGHIFCLDELFRFDDAILAAVHLLNYLSTQPEPLSALIASLPQYHTSPNYRLYCPDEQKAAVIEALVTSLAAQFPVDQTDGARVEMPGGWALMRRSKTQPALTVRIEGETEADLRRLETDILGLVRQTLQDHHIDPDHSLH